jgi:hypothetical protein
VQLETRRKLALAEVLIGFAKKMKKVDEGGGKVVYLYEVRDLEFSTRCDRGNVTQT